MKRWVFSSDMNVSILNIQRNEFGREFHRNGAIWVKALSPYTFVLPLLATRRFWDAERKDFDGTYCKTRSERYSGDRPWSDLKVSKIILNWIRNLTGSQCKSLRMAGVMCWHFFCRETRRAAEWIQSYDLGRVLKN